MMCNIRLRWNAYSVFDIHYANRYLKHATRIIENMTISKNKTSNTSVLIIATQKILMNFICEHVHSIYVCVMSFGIYNNLQSDNE